MEDLLATIERVGQQGSWEWRPSDDSMVWSDNMFRIFGLEPGSETPSFDLFYDLVHPGDRDHVRAQVADWRKEGFTGGTMTYWIIRPDGEERRILARTAEVHDGPNKKRVGVVVDTTEQVRAEREINVLQAASDVLAGWTSVDEDAPRLVAALANAFELDRGIFWVPGDDGLLRPRAAWRSPDWESGVDEAELFEMRLARGSGASGRAWELQRPIVQADLPRDPTHAYGDLARRDNLHGAIAIPAVRGSAVYAVIALAGPHVLDMTERFYATLVGVGATLGDLLSRHSAELGSRVLTDRETEILQLVADGLNGPEVGRRLGIAPTTAKTHFHRIYEKLGVSDRAAAVATAMRRGMVS